MDDTLFPPPTDEQLAALRTTHGELFRLANPSIDHVYIKRPTKAAYKAYQREREADGAETRGNANENLLRGLCVYPDKAALVAAIERLPGLPDDLIEPILKIAGVSAKATFSKS